MLLRQDSRRHKIRHLFAAHNSLERGAHRDLCLAVAHIAAQKPVHGPGSFHIRLDLRDGRRLIGCLFVRERLFEFSLPGRIRPERKPFALIRIACSESRSQASFSIPLRVLFFILCHPYYPVYGVSVYGHGTRCISGPSASIRQARTISRAGRIPIPDGPYIYPALDLLYAAEPSDTVFVVYDIIADSYIDEILERELFREVRGLDSRGFLERQDYYHLVAHKAAPWFGSKERMEETTFNSDAMRIGNSNVYGKTSTISPGGKNPLLRDYFLVFITEFDQCLDDALRVDSTTYIQLQRFEHWVLSACNAKTYNRNSTI
jgi:hypothetical protein